VPAFYLHALLISEKISIRIAEAQDVSLEALLREAALG
jgi:hypothetical protein